MKYFYILTNKYPKWDKTSFFYRRLALKCAEQHKFKENTDSSQKNLCKLSQHSSALLSFCKTDLRN